MRQRLLSIALVWALFLSIAVPALAAEQPSEIERAGAYLRELEIMEGDASGDLKLDAGLTRAELAVLLARLTVNQEHLHADHEFYARQCKFADVPEWARLYVGYCATSNLMSGYDNGSFGPNDSVTPQAACTVVLRYMVCRDPDWDYHTAVDKANQKGLLPDGGLSQDVTRGEMAVLIYRAMGNQDTGGPEQESAAPQETPAPQEPSGLEGRAGLSRNADGSINPPADGSRYVPQDGDVIRCDDGTNYTLTDVSRWDKSMFAEGPLPPLPEPTCDWSQFPEVELPLMEVRHMVTEYSDELFVLNLYETRRMQYTLYNLIGSNSETWENGAPKLNYAKTGPLVNVHLTLVNDWEPQAFWPWKVSNIENLFNSRPVSQYHVQAWDHYNRGHFLETQYLIQSF